ncbi:MAG: ATP-binding protein, partial [Sphingomonadales bacterium]
RAELTPEKRRRYAESIIETVDRATTLTSHLLAFSRRQPLQPEVIDLATRLDAFADVLTRTLGSRYDVVLDLGPDLWKVEADPAQLETALLNAAINARDAMPEGGRITLTARNQAQAEADYVCVALTDTGSGMPQEVIDRAFEPFFTTKPVGKGTGLGLSQIHGFAAQTGGRAEIESKPGEGTTVRLVLPRTRKALAAEGAKAASAALPPSLRVLLVEDNAQVQQFASDLLEELGCAVTAAADAAEALRILESEKIDLLFSDVVMPGMSGIALATTVRERFPAMPIVLATGYSAEMAGDTGRAFPVVAKPYGAQSVSAAIRDVLDGGREQARA